MFQTVGTLLFHVPLEILSNCLQAYKISQLINSFAKTNFFRKCDAIMVPLSSSQLLQALLHVPHFGLTIVVSLAK